MTSDAVQEAASELHMRADRANDLIERQAVEYARAIDEVATALSGRVSLLEDGVAEHGQSIEITAGELAMRAGALEKVCARLGQAIDQTKEEAVHSLEGAVLRLGRAVDASADEQKQRSIRLEGLVKDEIETHVDQLELTHQGFTTRFTHIETVVKEAAKLKASMANEISLAIDALRGDLTDAQRGVADVMRGLAEVDGSIRHQVCGPPFPPWHVPLCAVTPLDGQRILTHAKRGQSPPSPGPSHLQDLTGVGQHWRGLSTTDLTFGSGVSPTRSSPTFHLLITLQHDFLQPRGADGAEDLDRWPPRFYR